MTITITNTITNTITITSYEHDAAQSSPFTVHCSLFTDHSPTGTAFTADRKLSGWSPNSANTINPDDGVVWFSMIR